MSLVATVVAILCFLWSIQLLQQGEITVGIMALFLQLSGSLSTTFSALAGLIPGAISAATAAGRIMAIIDLPTEDPGDTEAAQAFIQTYGQSRLSVQGDGISYHYKNSENVLENSQFRADSGEIVAVIGPSGEGKTTLLRLLLGIVTPQSGALTLHSEDGTAIPLSAATRSLFAYVPQGNTLFTGTVAENLRLLCPDATDEALQEALRLACADTFVNRLPLGLDTPVREQGNFSEGQLQRLCIARALLSDAPILLMDECTSALDIDTERQVLQNILTTQKGRICIVTTHRPSVQEISHRVYAIRGNRIEAVTME